MSGVSVSVSVSVSAFVSAYDFDNVSHALYHSCISAVSVPVSLTSMILCMADLVLVVSLVYR